MSLPVTLPPPTAARLPRAERFTLANGIRVHVVERATLPIVDVLLGFGAGAELDPLPLAGRAWLTGELWTEGTLHRDGRAFAEEVERLGASIHARAGWDDTSLSLHVLSARLEPALALLAEAVREPAFEAAAFAQKQRERLAALLQERSEPRALAATTFARTVYQAGHPYARPLAGTEASVRALSPAHLREHYRSACTAGNAFLVVVGDVRSAELRPLLERTLGSWATSASAPAAVLPAAPRPGERRAVLVHRAGAPQAELRVGHAGAPRHAPDYYALQVLNTMLGGAFTSRINIRLREEKGYTYGARSGLAFRRGGGPFVVSTAVQAAAAADAVADILRELERIREEPAGEAELERARRYLTLGLGRAFESTSGVAEHLAEQALYDLGDSYFEAYAARIAAVSAADVQGAARRHLDPERAAIVVVADRALAPALRAVTGVPTVVREAEEI